MPILADDDDEALAARVLEMEHRCYPLAIKLIAEGRVRIIGNRVFVEGGAPSTAVLMNPGDGN